MTRCINHTILLLSAVCSICVQAKADDKSVIMSDLRSGKYSEAAARLKEALRGSPNDASLWTMNGFALVHLDKPKEALASYNRALDLSADYVPALEGAAEIEFTASDQRAVPLLHRLLQINPRDETAHAMLAALAYKRDECTTVVEEFQQAPVAIGSQVQALQEFGYCLVKLKRTVEAIPVFQRLTDLQPQSERARYNLAVVQSASERYQDAIATLTRSGGARQEDPEALDLLAQNYEMIGDTPRAVASLREAIVEKPDIAEYYVDFANICLTHSSFQVGVDMLNAGLERMPQSAALYLARGILYIQLGQYDRSEQDFAKAEKFDPKLEYGAAAEGLAELQQNNLGKAEAVVRERLRKNPNDAFLHYLLAETLLRKGANPGSAEFAEAIKSAQRAVQLQNKFALARDVLGRLYLEQGKLAEAIQQSRLAFEQDPADQTALYHLITALRKGGKTEEIPPLAKKLAALREQAELKEASEHRYALVEIKPSEASH